VKLYIPLAIGQTVPQIIMDAIGNQTVQPDVILCSTKGIINSNHSSSPEKLKGEATSRNKALALAWLRGEEFFLMQDRDCYHRDSHTFEDALAFLVSDPKLGAVSIHRSFKDAPKEDHVMMMAMACRLEAFKEDFMFRVDKRNHMCLAMLDDLAKAGYKMEYVPESYGRIKELNG
jgi:hypothetical protein